MRTPKVIFWWKSRIFKSKNMLFKTPSGSLGCRPPYILIVLKNLEFFYCFPLLIGRLRAENFWKGHQQNVNQAPILGCFNIQYYGQIQTHYYACDKAMGRHHLPSVHPPRNRASHLDFVHCLQHLQKTTLPSHNRVSQIKWLLECSSNPTFLTKIESCGPNLPMHMTWTLDPAVSTKKMNALKSLIQAFPVVAVIKDTSLAS